MRFTDQEEEVCGDETYTEILSGSQDAIGNDDEAANGNTGDQSADSTQDQASRYVPVFEPIDANEARARASTEQWRTFTVLLEPQVKLRTRPSPDAEEIYLQHPFSLNQRMSVVSPSLSWVTEFVFYMLCELLELCWGFKVRVYRVKKTSQISKPRSRQAMDPQKSASMLLESNRGQPIRIFSLVVARHCTQLCPPFTARNRGDSVPVL